MTDKSIPLPILQHLRRLLLWVMVPLALLVGTQGYLEYRQASRAAEGFVVGQAAMVASEVAGVLAATQRGLELMATRPGVVSMNPERCDPGLRDLIALQPIYANATVIDTQGALICGAQMPETGQPPLNVSDRDWFQAVLAGQPFALGEVRRGPILGRWVSSAAVPVRGADKAVIGVMVVAIDLARWPLRAPSSELSQEAALGVVSRSGTVVLRSPEADKWIGRDLRGTSLLADALRVGQGSFVAKGAQGFDRFWAVQPIAGTSWLAYAGVRASEVRAGPLRAAALSLGSLLVVALAAWWLAIKASRRLSEPITQLARVAHRAGSGDPGARASVDGPAEIVAVAREFNRMLDLRGSAEAALRASEQQLRETLRLLPASVTLQSLDGVLLDCSDEFCRVAGYSREELIGRPQQDWGLWVDPEQWLSFYQALQREGRVDDFEFEQRHRNGGITLRQVSARLVTLGGEPGFLKIAHDVTARRLAENNLLATQARLQATLNALPDLMLEVGSDGRLLSYRTHRPELLAAPPEVFLGKTLAEVLPAAAAEVCMSALRRAAATGWATGGTYSLQLPQGEHWFELSVAAMPATGEGQSRFIMLARDITARHHSEQASQESAMQLGLVIRGGDIGYWDWDLVSGAMEVNERWFTMLGLEAQNTGPSVDLWNALVHPEDAPKLAHAFETVIQNPTGEAGEAEIRARHRNGHYVWILDKFTVVSRTADGTPLRVVGTHMDITPRKRAELALQASLRDKEALLGEVHHRVKNNLQVVTSLLRLEARRSRHPPTQVLLAEMQARIRSMALLHESIYREGNFAAIDLGNYLRQVATQALRSLHSATGAAQVQMHFELGSLQVGLDQATPCGLLLTELVSNALKHAFATAAGGEIRVELQPVAGSAADRWCLRVSDNGVGLPADFAARQQASLGLQLAASLALQIGGSLEVGPAAARPGEAAAGASFSVSFAIAAQAPTSGMA